MDSVDKSETQKKFDDILMGLEVGLITPNQLVDDFRERAATDLGSAAVWCVDLANRIDSTAASWRAYSKDGKPPLALNASADLVRAMFDEYKNGDDAAKITILERLVQPILDPGNTSFGLSFVEKMKNPYMVGDIIRIHPILCPAFDLYAKQLQDSGCMQRPGLIDTWLGQQDDSLFAAISVALKYDDSNNVSIAMAAKPDLFRGAAHVVAARYDLLGSWYQRTHPNIDPRTFVALQSEEYFVAEFAKMVCQEVDEAKWLPVNPAAPKWGFQLP